MSAHTLPRVRLTYVRHGETAWSLSGQHTGLTDIPLTAHGEAQARALRARFAGAGFAHVFSSPRLRARSTCELSGASNAPDLMPEAAEWDYGDYERLTSLEIRRKRPEWDIFRDGCPNGETPADIAARADGLIARISAMTGSVALFSHGQFGLVLAARWIGLEVSQARHFALAPASVSVLAFEAGRPDMPVIALWNATVP